MHRTKSAGAGANVAKDHEGCSLLAITFHSVGAFGIIANCFQPQFIQQTLGHMICVPGRNRPFQPTGKPSRGRDLCAIRNFRICNYRKSKGHSAKNQGEKDEPKPETPHIVVGSSVPAMAEAHLVRRRQQKTAGAKGDGDRENPHWIAQKGRKSTFEIRARLRRTASEAYNPLSYGKEENQIESV